MTKKTNIRGTYAFNPKNNHSYVVTSNRVGTRNRVTMIDIYGKTHRAAITDFIQMTDFEAAIVMTGERITRRKAATNDAEKQMMYCYREFIKSHK